MTTIDHLGIAVKDLDQAKKLYAQLGLKIVSEETVEHEKVRVAMIPVGQSRIELLEATDDDSPIARFIARRGEGIHHLALHVPNISEAVEQLKKDGVRLISEDIKVGAGGHLYVFVHPSSAGGVLLEICQDPVTPA
jgi:methylmalonyl-CoA epimerase